MSAKLRLISTAPPKHRPWVSQNGNELAPIERTPKQAGEYEFDHRGRLVPVKL